MSRRTAVQARSVACVTSANKVPWLYVGALIHVLILLLLVMHFAGSGMPH